MDIKDLNRSQFLLLILLIMLVTSITTATVTVTLMDQSPQAGVVNTINRVIERVIPGATTTVIQVVKEPVTVDQGEQIIKAMEAIAPYMVRLEKQDPLGVKERLGSGFIVRSGWAVTAMQNVPAGVKTVTLSQASGSTLAEVSSIDEKNSIAFLKFAPIEGSTALSTGQAGFPTSTPAWAEASPSSGQTSITLSISDNNNVEILTGLVMGVINASNTVTDSSPITAEVIRTGSVIGDNLGGPVLNFKGEIVGIGISRGYALSAQSLRVLVDQLQ